MIDTILFDVDSTLIDTASVMIDSLKITLKKLKNITIKDDSELYFILGITGEKAITKFVTNDAEKVILLNDWAKNVTTLKYKEKVFPGIKNLLADLKKLGYTTGVVTSKNQYEMDSEFNRFHLNTYFDCIINASDTKKHKPDAEPINFALKKLNKPSNSTVYVGDSPYDLETAINSDVNFAWAKWGSKAEEKLFNQAQMILYKPTDLFKYLGN